MSNSVQHINAILIPTAQTDSTTASPVVIKFIVADGGMIYYGDRTTVNWAVTAANTYNNTANEFSSVVAGGNFYFVDGTNTLVISGTTGSYSAIATGGIGQPPTGSRLVSLYRNRLVLTRTASDPQNWFMSHTGQYTNFDYDDLTIAGAVAGNISDTAGKVGDVITAFVPYSDDYAVFGLSDSVYVLHGDPRAGGNIDVLNKGGGIVGSEAWAFDPEGRMFYMSRRDLMTVQPGGGSPQSVSQNRLTKYLSTMDFSIFRTRMAWDVQNKGLWIFFTGRTTSDANHGHLFWDRRTDAFLPMQFPDTFGPTAVKSLAGETAIDRQIMLGTFDGYICTFANNYVADVTSAIESYVKLSPVKLADNAERGVLNETELVMGNVSQSKAQFDWYVGDTAQDALTTTSSAYTTTSFATGRVNFRARARGQTAVLRIYNNTIGRRFSIEGAVIQVIKAGRTR